MKVENKINRRMLFLLVLIFSVLVFSSLASATKVLHIGASHTIGSYGTTLDAMLRTTYGQTNVWTAAVCGAKANHFVDGLGSNCGTSFKDGASNSAKQAPFKIDDLVSSFNPDIVIVSLATNYLGSIGDTDKTKILDLLKTIQGKTCFWIGAPVSTASNINPTKINTDLRSLVGSQCTFIDPVPFTNTKDLRTDGIHFTDATLWATEVWKIVIAGKGVINKGTPSSTGTSSGGPSPAPTPTPVSPTTNLIGCSSLTTCKEIDDVWSKLTLTVSAFSYWKNMVWDPINTVFKDYNVYYGTTVSSTSKVATSATEQEIDALKGKTADEIKNFITAKLGSQYIEDIDYLTKVLYAERRCTTGWEKERGAIAQVVINRVRSSTWDNTVKEVLISSTTGKLWNVGFSTTLPAMKGIEDPAKMGCTLSALKFMLCVGEEDAGAKLIGGRTHFVHRNTQTAAGKTVPSWNYVNPVQVQSSIYAAHFSGSDTSAKDCSLRLYH